VRRCRPFFLLGAICVTGQLSALGARHAVALLLATLAGICAWPIMVLVVSCGRSVLGLLRLDLMLLTIVRSLPAYVLTLLAVYLAFGIKIAIAVLVSAAEAEREIGVNWGAIFVLPVLLVGVGLLFDVIAMRAIGNYYRCFKNKFAWSWG